MSQSHYPTLLICDDGDGRDYVLHWPTPRILIEIRTPTDYDIVDADMSDAVLTTKVIAQMVEFFEQQSETRGGVERN